MRMARFACELGFEVDAGHAARWRAAGSPRIGGVAPERTFYELRRLVTRARRRGAGIELMDSVGLVATLLPELEALKGVEQNPYHHLDVWGHTLEVLEQLVVDATARPRGGASATPPRESRASSRARLPTS